MSWWLRIVLIILAIVVILGIVGYLQSEGIVPEFKWQGLTMLAAAFAGPIKLLVKSFGGKVKYADEILEKHENIRKEETIHRQATDEVILQKEAKIKELNSKIEQIDVKLQQIEEEKIKIPEEVENMTDTEKQSEAQKYWG